MNARQITRDFSVSPQITPEELSSIAAQGFRAIICNRPDGEAENQPNATTMRDAAEQAGLGFVYVPVPTRDVSASDARKMADALASLPGPVLAYCGSGARAEAVWNAAQALRASPKSQALKMHDVVIVGGGSAGIATAASLLKRRAGLDIALIEPADVHYYQPGWTLVGAGVFQPQSTCRPMSQVMPEGVQWIKTAAAGFAPDENRVILADGSDISYRVLIVATGIRLAWETIPGLAETLGRNGVTSNYRFDLAPYTNRLTSELKSGRAIFTQPPMPIKCAGAPQKAMYLSCDRWLKAGALKNISVEFDNAGAVLFGVAAYVPALMSYIERYNIQLNFETKLVKVDGEARVASFERKGANGPEIVERAFDMLHAVPPQVAPDCVRTSPLAAANGFAAVDEATLQHPAFPNVFALGDACSASNAKTAAAARQQAPVVAVNVLAQLEGKPLQAAYTGYGSCPLTVEHGRIVLAEFGYGGKLMPTFPTWLLDGTKPTRAAWFLKDRLLPSIYWQGMLKGREWLARPQPLNTPAQPR
ncbi:MAG: TIGR01244 family phosphatase [Rhodospirillales bacterium]|nr:TIGR01244 family phosphatase [Rhodospirillales bacterium]MDE1882521.1 TIGR01244 family phosphatase [Rhodospirillales bacterium]